MKTNCVESLWSNYEDCVESLWSNYQIQTVLSLWSNYQIQTVLRVCGVIMKTNCVESLWSNYQDKLCWEFVEQLLSVFLPVRQMGTNVCRHWNRSEHSNTGTTAEPLLSQTGSAIQLQQTDLNFPNPNTRLFAFTVYFCLQLLYLHYQYQLACVCMNGSSWKCSTRVTF